MPFLCAHDENITSKNDPLPLTAAKKKKEVKENILGHRENGHSTVRISIKVNSRMFLAGSVGVSANHISIDLVYR